MSTQVAQGLLASQMPELAGLPLQRVHSTGTDNFLFRCGQDKCLRLPRSPACAKGLRRELQVLGRFQGMSWEVPHIYALGRPEGRYPCPWVVLNWIDGVSASAENVSDQPQLAIDLAGFLRELWHLDTADGPPAGAENHFRGSPLMVRDALVRQAMQQLEDLYDVKHLLVIWEHCLGAPKWNLAPRWVHGDLLVGNLLAKNGRLTAVIDFGLCAAGDPAVDLMAAWTLFSGANRQAFFTAAHIDEASWLRAKGWALSWALIALAYYRNKESPFLVELSKRTLVEVLEEEGDKTVF